MSKKYTHIFLSYCHEDEAEVGQVREELLAAGEEVWWDKDILGGQDWKQAIRAALRVSYAVVVFFSEEAEARSESGIYPEIRDAIKTFRTYAAGKVFLIPVRLSECEIPMIEIDDTRTLDELQVIDLFPAARRAEGIKVLIDSIRASPRHP